MKLNCGSKQRGAVVVIVAIVLPVLLFAMGWALDFGHVFVNKTRLQNALDATALSAAIAINYDVNKDKAAAEAKARDTFNQFKAAPGNNELAVPSMDAGALVFDYSRTLDPWASFNPTPADPFAFVKVTSTNMLNVTPVLIRILNKFSGDIAVPAIATAGPAPNNCGIMPFFICADMTKPAGTYYGYIPNATYTLLDFKDSGLITAGNFALLDLVGRGGKGIRDVLQGKAFNACPFDNKLPLNTDPGKKVGNVDKGLNYRIDTLDSNNNDYFSPKPPTTSTAYTDYLADGGNNERLIPVPIGDCKTLTKPGQAEIDQVGTACVFVTVHYGVNAYTTPCPKGSKAPECSKDSVSFQFIRSCEQNGVWNPKNAVLNGPYKVVLFKSPESGDS